MRATLLLLLTAAVVAPFLLTGDGGRAADPAPVPPVPVAVASDATVLATPGRVVATDVGATRATSEAPAVVRPDLAAEFGALFADASDDDRDAALAVFGAAFAGR